MSLTRQTRIILSTIFLLITIVYSIAFSKYFVSLEQTIYFWDFGGYHKIAIYQASNFSTSIRLFLTTVLSSLGYDYNYIFTLPLIPIIDLLGNIHSRVNYIQGLSFIYFLPFSLILGLLSTKLVNDHHFLIYWIAVFVSLTSSVAWLPVLRGYPDSGAACLIMLAIWAYLDDFQLRHYWQIILIGICLAFATLFRRHFGYSALAFGVSLVTFSTLGFIKNVYWHNHQAARDFFRLSIRIFFTFLVSIIFLFLIARPFINLVMSTDYRTIYSSYELSILKTIMGIIPYFGWGVIVVALFGYLASIISPNIVRIRVLFILLFSLIISIIWFGYVKQINPHYTLHFTSVILLGVTLFIYLVLTSIKGVPKIIIILIITGYFIINSIIWLSPMLLNTTQSIRSLFAQWSEPIKRNDYPEIIKLTEYFHNLDSLNANIYVVDSSGIFTYDLLVSAQQQLYPKEPMRIIDTPQVDSRDYYPLEKFLLADYIVVSDPLQIVLSESEQGVVSSIYYAFKENWEIVNDFIELPDNFNLMWDVRTKIFKRISPTTNQVAIRGLSKMIEVIGEKPGSQKDWIILKNYDSSSVNLENNKYQINTILSPGTESVTTFLYIGKIPENSHLSGTMNSSNCAGTIIELQTADEKGEITLQRAEVINTDQVSWFNWDLSNGFEDYALITFSLLNNKSIEKPCELSLDGINIGSIR